MRLPILGLALFLVSPFAFASEPSHCAADEDSIWSCSSKNKRYEVCAAKNLSRTAGYMQYRAGTIGAPEFVFPSARVHPKGPFHYSLLAQGAQLSFENGAYQYDLTEPLKGNATIWVTKQGENAKLAVNCQRWSDTLTLTSTLERFESIGLYQGVSRTGVGVPDKSDVVAAKAVDLKLGQPYTLNRDVLLRASWKPDTKNVDGSVLDKAYPELSCGAGYDAVCQAAFTKDKKVLVLTVDQNKPKLPLVHVNEQSF